MDAEGVPEKSMKHKEERQKAIKGGRSPVFDVKEL